MVELSDKTRNIIGLLLAVFIFVTIKYWDKIYPIVLFFALLVTLIITIKKFYKPAYKESINIVPKKFVYNQNTIRNQHCSVKYTPGESVVVSDNPVSRQMRDMRTFTLNKNNVNNVDSCWDDICKFYSDVTYFETLVSFFQQDNVYVDIILVPLTTKSAEPKKVEHPQPKKDIVNSERSKVDNNAKIEAAFANEPEIIQPSNKLENTADEQGFFDMDALVAQTNKMKHSAQKQEDHDDKNLIYINYATAEQIANLPGLNIVGAKKIVTFRDRVRLFNSADDFIEIAQIPKQFTNQVKSMITLKQPKEEGNSDNNFGRIIDL